MEKLSRMRYTINEVVKRGTIPDERTLMLMLGFYEKDEFDKYVEGVYPPPKSLEKKIDKLR